ncbi:P-loop containing nucleoside triphosphate hydrolase protein [Aureobasidium pullulans]|uniref:ATP-dependent RNA helicase n=1 Tax=Aureobasidium pullulans TaxID=5580 RepID=A0A4T0C653_AURPU|nr:P-loop containing nucleoside triphosphate hydrolase protein [Aureobasidium pullulans]
MDPLRLLTRSTKFAKKPSSAATQIQTPSSGPASNPQLFDHDDDSQPSNRKRKRGSEPVSASLDFFGGGASAKEREHDSGDDQPRLQQEQALVPSALSAEERKQLLGRHKVKLTLFHQSSEAPAKKKKKEKGDKDKKQSKKSAEQATPLYPAPVEDFNTLGPRYRISKALLRNIKDNGYSTTTEVQLAALPLLLGSRADLLSPDQTPSEGQEEASVLDVDLLSIAPTGSGKTLAFMIPLIHALVLSRRSQPQAGPQAIILAPTKELASQIANEGRKLALNTAIRITNVRKGMHLGSDQPTSTDVSEKDIPPVKADILVSTPAALKNAIGDAQTSSHALSQIRFLILDEADVLLDPLFRDQTLGVWNALSNPSLRLGFWSATMGSNIEELVKATIKSRAETLSGASTSPVPIAPFVRLVVGLKDSAVPNVDHRLIYAATEQGKLMALRQLLHPTSTGVDKQPVVRAPFLIFTQTIERAVALHSELLYDIPAEAGGISRIAVLHSDLSDTARDHVMTRFRKGEVWILITTDLLSRGVDFRGINAVVNYDAPSSAAAYVHRVGRTGRAGREGGVALTYYTDDDVASIKTVANIIVASQKQRGAAGGTTNIQQWLLDALPTPSKRDKQQLKKRGIETRRSASGKDTKTGKPKARISTKSGYIRKLENNRKGAVAASRNPQESGDASDSGESFDGFEE